MICYINYKQIFSEIKQPYLRNITDYYLHNQLFSNDIIIRDILETFSNISNVCKIEHAENMHS